MIYDSIELYDDETIKAWRKRFSESPDDVIIISDIPFSYYEIRNELIKRQNIKDESE